MSNPIGWCDKTINPLVGCTPVSEGCEHCYAARMASRNLCPQWKGTAKKGRWTGTLKYIPSEWDRPRHWRKARRIFVCSMSDPFHGSAPSNFYTDMLDETIACPQHTFLLLTKRPGRAVEMTKRYWDRPDNLWLGITAENQARFDERHRYLIRANVTHRFLNLEPLLGPIDLREVLRQSPPQDEGTCVQWFDPQHRRYIKWVIVGGENGSGARPCHPDWVRSIRDQCQEYGIPFWFKGWGAWVPESQGGGLYTARMPSLEVWPDGETFFRTGAKFAGCQLDGREYRELHEGLKLEHVR